MEVKSINALVDNSQGYSVLPCRSLSMALSRIVTDHVNVKLQTSFESLEIAVRHLARDSSKHPFKEKRDRLLSANLAERADTTIREELADRLPSHFFISDEEMLGYCNFYWRAVRPMSSVDVGSVHADRWFWELRHDEIPDGYRRIKCWLPLVQPDDECALLVSPGSHLLHYLYGYQESEDGMRRPRFDPTEHDVRMVSADVRKNYLIFFHDSLLHGGRAISSYRVSFEFTLVVPCTETAFTPSDSSALS